MWNGAVIFGDNWVAYLGATDQNSRHAHSATQLAFGGAEPIVILAPAGVVKGTALCIFPGTPHVAQPSQAQVLFVYLAPQSPLSLALLRRFSAVTPPGIASLDALLPYPAAAAMDAAAIVATLERQLCIAPAPLHANLAVAIDFLHRQLDHPGCGIAQAARAAGLSESRLRALAKDQLGVSLSQWLLWRKLERAAAAIAAGQPLAVAAAMGGFADQAHLSRTMRRMFGITPTEAIDPLQARKRFVQDS